MDFKCKIVNCFFNNKIDKETLDKIVWLLRKQTYQRKILFYQPFLKEIPHITQEKKSHLENVSVNITCLE